MNIVQGALAIPEPDPNLLGVEEGRVHNDGGDAGKREAVAHGEGGRQEQGRVLLVLCHVEVELGREDAADVVRALGVVPGPAVAEGQVVGVPGARPVDAGRGDPVEDDDADERVEDGVERGHERGAQVAGDLRPVQGQREQSHARPTAKDLIDGDIVRRNESRKGEDAEGLE